MPWYSPLRCSSLLLVRILGIAFTCVTFLGILRLSAHESLVNILLWMLDIKD